MSESENGIWKKLFPGTSVTIEGDKGEVVSVKVLPAFVEHMPVLIGLFKDALDNMKIDISKGIPGGIGVNIVMEVLRDERVMDIVGECCEPNLIGAPHFVLAKIAPAWAEETFFKGDRIQMWMDAFEKLNDSVPQETKDRVKKTTSRSPRRSARSSRPATAKRR